MLDGLTLIKLANVALMLLLALISVALLYLGWLIGNSCFFFAYILIYLGAAALFWSTVGVCMILFCSMPNDDFFFFNRNNNNNSYE